MVNLIGVSMRLNIKNNIKDVTKDFTKMQKKQIPFATSIAINNTLFGLRKEMSKQLDKKLDRPTPFTKRGFLVDKSKKTKLVGTLFLKDVVADYLQYQVDGGIRSNNKLIPVPNVQNAKLNKYGNIIGKKTGLVKKKTQFFGTINGTKGVWDRTKNDGLKLIIGLQRNVSYEPKFPFYVIADKYSKNTFNKNLIKSLNKALKTAK